MGLPATLQQAEDYLHRLYAAHHVGDEEGVADES